MNPALPFVRRSPYLLHVSTRTRLLAQLPTKDTNALYYRFTARSFSSTGPRRANPRHLSAWLLFGTGGAVLGGSILYAIRGSNHPELREVIASPSCIPSSSKVKPAFVIASPADPSFFSKIASFIRKRIFSPLRTGLRFLHLCIIFCPVLVAAPMLFIGAREDDQGGEKWGAIWWYDFLTRSMQRAGPTFIKLSQWASSRRDLFPEALCNRLGSLQATTKPHSIHHTIAVVENVFSRPFTEVFETFDAEPIGSGAIAQVYKATLRPNLLSPSYLSEKRAVSQTIPTPLSPTPPLPAVTPTAAVAVKVLHPHVEDMIRRDLAIMGFFARLLNMLPGVQWLSLEQEVKVFGEMMNEQLDLRHEARNLQRFEENFKHRRAAVSFPRPLEEYTSHDLLVEEFQHAVPLHGFLRYGGGPYDRAMGTMGLDAFLNMLLLDNFVHADLHPGNILVRFYKPTTGFVLRSIIASLFNSDPPIDPVKTSDAEEVVRELVALRKRGNREEWNKALQSLHANGYQPELVFLDAGLVTTLSEMNRRNFLDLFQAIATFDGYRAGQLMVSRSSFPELAIDPETFALKMQHLVLSIKAKTFSLGQIRISDVLSSVLRFVREHHVKMEGEFVNTVISVLLLEGIGRQLDPDMDLFKSALPILRQLGRHVTAKEAIADGPAGRTGAMIKFWVWLEARELINAAVINVDELIKIDWLSPNV